MRLAAALCLAVALILPTPQPHAQDIDDPALVAAVLGDIKTVQDINGRMDQHLLQLIEAGGSLEHALYGRYPMEAAINRTRTALADTAAPIESYLREVPGLTIRSTGDAEFDPLIDGLLRFVKSKPDLLVQMREVLGAQVVAAEAGDYDEKTSA